MNGDKIMVNQIVKNEIFIRGMIVGKYPHEEKTTIVVCSRSANKEHSSYQYITFFGDLKEKVDNMKICEKVVLTAYAWVFRDQETKLVNSDNIRLRGTSIETSVEFSKRVFAAAGVPIYGLQMLDCMRFTFNGSIFSISKTKNGKISILLAVSDGERKGFSLIPLMYAGRGDEDEIEAILNRYSKGQVISVKGFISQKSVDVEPTEDSKFNSKYKNTYYITTFLTGDTDADFDEMI